MLNYRKEIYIPLIMAAAMLACSMSWLFVVMFQLLDFSAKERLAQQQRYYIIKLESTIADAESGLRGYLLTGNPVFLSTFNKAKREVNKLFAKVMLLEHGHLESKQIITETQLLVEDKFLVLDRALQIQMSAGAYAPHLNLIKDTGKLAMEKIKKNLSSLDYKTLQRKNIYHSEIKAKIKEAMFGATVLIIIVMSLLAFTYKHAVNLFAKLIDNNIIVDRLSYEAFHDQLTGLLNRRGFMNQLKNIYEYASIKNKKFAILYMDLNKFKQVNDRYGHHYGDAVLIKVATLLKSQLRACDGLARLGGDEFSAVINNYSDRYELTQLTERIKQSVEQPINIESELIEVGVSVGVAEYPNDAKSIETLLTIADEAMYESKFQS